MMTNEDLRKIRAIWAHATEYNVEWATWLVEKLIQERAKVLYYETCKSLLHFTRWDDDSEADLVVRQEWGAVARKEILG